MNDDITVDVKTDSVLKNIHVKVNLIGMDATRFRIKLGVWLVRLGLFIAGVDYEVNRDN